jgi:hypothetical protein
MVLFFTSTLLIAAAGMISLLWLKRYELRTGRVFFAQVRPALGEFFGRGLLWIEGALPAAAGRALRRGWNLLRHLFHAAAALVVIVAEHALERLLQSLRYKTSAPGKSGEASPFLREVAEHKKKILQSRSEE